MMMANRGCLAGRMGSDRGIDGSALTVAESGGATSMGGFVKMYGMGTAWMGTVSACKCPETVLAVAATTVAKGEKGASSILLFLIRCSGNTKRRLTERLGIAVQSASSASGPCPEAPRAWITGAVRNEYAREDGRDTATTVTVNEKMIRQAAARPWGLQPRRRRRAYGPLLRGIRRLIRGGRPIVPPVDQRPPAFDRGPRERRAHRELLRADGSGHACQRSRDGESCKPMGGG